MKIFAIDEEYRMMDDTYEEDYMFKTKYRFRPEAIDPRKVDFGHSDNAKNLVLFFADKKKWVSFRKGELLTFIKKNHLHLRVGADPLCGLYGPYADYDDHIRQTPPYILYSEANPFPYNGGMKFCVTNLFVDRCMLGRQQEFMRLAVKRISIPEQKGNNFFERDRTPFNEEKDAFVKIFLKCGEYDPEKFIESLYYQTGFTKFLLIGGCPHYSINWEKFLLVPDNRPVEVCWLYRDGNITDEDAKRLDTISWDEVNKPNMGVVSRVFV